MNNLNTQFLMACQKGDLKKVRLLLLGDNLSERADIYYQDQRGWSALVTACAYGQLEIARFLLDAPELEHHAYLYQMTNSGSSCFMHACFKQHMDIIHYLLFEKSMLIDDYGISVLKQNAIYEPILKLITTRDLAYDLQDNLKFNQIVNKPRKI